MNKVVCIGEALIDFIPHDRRSVPMAGGAPANVSACVAKLGGRGVFLGKLSKDAYGFFLKHELARAGVDLSFTVYDSYKTAYSVVTLSDGDRSFSFYRENTADLNLRSSEMPNDLFDKGDILHFCSVSLVESPVKYAHKHAIELAKSAGAIISFDVNLRPALWNNSKLMTDTVKEFLRFADIIKVSEEELDFLTDGSVAELFEIAKNAKTVIVTKGADGAQAYDRCGKYIFVPAYCKRPVDTTGAGDCFIGSVLYLLSKGFKDFDISNMRYVLEFASRACSISVSRTGAINSYPTLIEVEKTFNYDL